MNPEAERLAQRGAFLSVMLTVMGGSLFLFVLFVACGGLAIYVLAVVLGLGVFGLVHYVLWGHIVSAQVTAEKPSAESPADQDGLEERREARDWTPEERSWYRRF